MTFVESIKTCFKKYATFSGRASRSEYFYFLLFFILLSVIPYMLIFAILPLLSVMVRRVHDINVSGWWCFATIFFLLIFTNIMGAFVFMDMYNIENSKPLLIAVITHCFIALLSIYILSKKGTIGDNRFGKDPLQN